MDAKKTAIIVLVVIAVLFVFILFAGWGVRDESAGLQSPASIDFLKGAFIRGRSVRPTEFVPADLIARSSTEPVEFTIKAADDVRVRTMKLEMIQGLEMELELIPKGDYGLPVSVKLRSNFRTTPKLQVFEEGAVLKAKCLRPDMTLAVCRLKLG